MTGNEPAPGTEGPGPGQQDVHHPNTAEQHQPPTTTQSGTSQQGEQREQPSGESAQGIRNVANTGPAQHTRAVSAPLRGAANINPAARGMINLSERTLQRLQQALPSGNGLGSYGLPSTRFPSNASNSNSGRRRQGSISAPPALGSAEDLARALPNISAETRRRLLMPLPSADGLGSYGFSSSGVPSQSARRAATGVQPAGVQPTGVQPTSVQPTGVQPTRDQPAQQGMSTPPSSGGPVTTGSSSSTGSTTQPGSGQAGASNTQAQANKNVKSNVESNVNTAGASGPQPKRAKKVRFSLENINATGPWPSGTIDPRSLALDAGAITAPQLQLQPESPAGAAAQPEPAFYGHGQGTNYGPPAGFDPFLDHESPGAVPNWEFRFGLQPGAQYPSASLYPPVQLAGPEENVQDEGTRPPHWPPVLNQPVVGYTPPYVPRDTPMGFFQTHPYFAAQGPDQANYGDYGSFHHVNNFNFNPNLNISNFNAYGTSTINPNENQQQQGPQAEDAYAPQAGEQSSSFAGFGNYDMMRPEGPNGPDYSVGAPNGEWAFPPGYNPILQQNFSDIFRDLLRDTTPSFPTGAGWPPAPASGHDLIPYPPPAVPAHPVVPAAPAANPQPATAALGTRVRGRPRPGRPSQTLTVVAPQTNPAATRPYTAEYIATLPQPTLQHARAQAPPMSHILPWDERDPAAQQADMDFVHALHYVCGFPWVVIMWLCGHQAGIARDEKRFKNFWHNRLRRGGYNVSRNQAGGSDDEDDDDEEGKGNGKGKGKGKAYKAKEPKRKREDADDEPTYTTGPGYRGPKPPPPPPPAPGAQFSGGASNFIVAA